MKICSNIHKEKVRKDQFFVLVDYLVMIKDKKEAIKFLNSFLSDSEKAYLGQRLNIIRMLAKDFSYSDVKEKINAQSAITDFKTYKV